MNTDFIASRDYFNLRKGRNNFVYIDVFYSKKINKGNVF